jgi:hypothetical protein
VSVKTRNHTTDKNEEKKDCYNLFYPKKKGGDPEAVVKMAAEIAQGRNAIQVWAAVRVDIVRQQYDIYWGLVADLTNKKQIPMSPSDRRRHRTLAVNVFDSRIEARWSNVKKSRLVGPMEIPPTTVSSADPDGSAFTERDRNSIS